jgi:peptidoglycan/xylan/chitin deacetylase (PgdA/CDA1 family)
MPRNEFGRIPAGRSTRSDLTRRGLLGIAAVLTGAGIADLIKSERHSSAATVSDASGPVRVPVVTRAQPGVTPSTTPHHHTSPSTPPTHAPEHHDGGHHAGHKAGAHGHGHGETTHHARKVEHVTLPPAKIEVRSRPIYYVDDLIHDPPKHAIALTVDDGPDPLYTPKVLRLLDKYRMQASFCVVGVHAEAYPKLIRDIHRAGHVIVNHTFTHVQPFNRQTEKRIVTEITKTQRTIERVAKVTPQLFRAPGGAWSPFIFRAVAAYDLIPLDWDVDPMDWAMPGTRKIERAMLKGRPNDIVLCHDGGGNRSETVRALRKVLPDWKHRGYVTIPLVVPSGPKLPLKPPRQPSNSPTPSTSPSGISTSFPTT